MVKGTIVVTGEPAAAALAREAGAEVVEDPEDANHSEAAVIGVRRAVQMGADCTVLLPGDCPLLEPRELDHLLTGLPDPFVTIVPDRHGTGTNALVLVPPGVIRPAFGEGSCERHQRIARDAGVPHVPGTLEPAPTDSPAQVHAAVAVARRVGYPLLVKAAAGGGGRGARFAEAAEAWSRVRNGATFAVRQEATERLTTALCGAREGGE